MAAILIFLLTSLPASSADNCGCGAGRVVVEKVDVIRGRNGVEIEITASGPMKIRSMRLPNPERFVIDVQDSIQGPLFTADQRRIPVNAQDIRAVRVGQLFQPGGDPVTRVVVDLATPQEMEVASAQNKIRLRLRSEGVQEAVAKPVRENAPAAAPVPVRPVAPPPARMAMAVPPSRPEALQVVAHKAETPRTAEPARNVESRPAQAAAPGEIGTHMFSAGVIPTDALAAAPEEDFANANATAVTPAQEAEAKPAGEVANEVQGSSSSLANSDAQGITPAEEAEAKLAGDAPAVPPPAVGIGVTGRHKDKSLGIEEEEAAIKATVASDKNLIASAKDGSGPAVGMRLSGAATAGYYAASTTNGYAAREASPVGSLRMDASGYVHSPGFLNFSVRPQGSAGRQSSEGVFPDGQGVSATTTFLGGGVAPLTVSYNRLNRKLVTFGPLDRLAGLEANTFQDSLGANWRLMVKHLPELGVNFSRYSDSYEPLAALAPKTTNAGRLLSGDITQKVLGWNLQTRYKLERSSQDLINIFDPTQAPYLYTRKGQEARASADRELGNWGSASFIAGKTRSENEVQGRPFDQSFRFLSGNSFLHAGKKLTVSLRAGVTDNAVGASLDRTLGSNGVAPDQPLILVPTQARLEMVNYAASTQYAVTSDLRVQTDVLRETTRAPQGSSIATSTSDLTSLQAGIAYSHHFRLWQFQTYYAANGGRFTYASTGSGRSLGHRANAGVTIGSLQSLELTATAHGSLQNVSGNTYVYDRSAGANITLARSLFEHWSVRASYDRERNQYKFTSTQLSSIGNAGSLTVVHPRAELSASYNVRDGMTFQADPRLQFVSSSQTALLLGAYPGTLIVPTGATWSSAALAIHPAHKLTTRVAYMRSRQRLQGAVSNYYTDWEASAGYQFRSITVDAGYVMHDQNFAVDMFKRNRFYFRVVREFTVY